MSTAKSAKTSKVVPVSLDKVKQLLIASTTMTDLAEEILEEHGAYSKEFLRRVQQASIDAKAGRVYTVESLDELLER